MLIYIEGDVDGDMDARVGATVEDGDSDGATVEDGDSDGATVWHDAHVRGQACVMPALEHLAKQRFESLRASQIHFLYL
jgi:hypothetical protein